MKKLIKKAIPFVATLLPGGAILAAEIPDITTVSPPAPVTGIGQFIGIFCVVANWLFTLLIILSVVVLLIAAFLFLTSGGAEEKTTSAKNWLAYAVIGIVIALLAKGLVLAVATIFVEATQLPQCT